MNAALQEKRVLADFLAGRTQEVLVSLDAEGFLSPKARLVYGVCARKHKRNDLALKAFEHLLQHEMPLLQAENQLDVLDGLTACYLDAGDMPRTRHYGTEAIKARQQVFTEPVQEWNDGERAASVTAYRARQAVAGRVPAEGLRVISYCLYGNSPMYCEMLIINLAALKALFPGWQVWLYHDDTVPTEALERMAGLGARLIAVGEAERKYPGTMWRFLALEDERVAYVIFRDADSYVTPREKRCIDDWLLSDAAVHTIRDWYTHSELMLAGMWGAHAPQLRKIRTAMDMFLQRAFTPSHADQHFLRRFVWPIVRSSACVHDSVFATTERRFPASEPATLAAHIGNRLSSFVKIPMPSKAQAEEHWRCGFQWVQSGKRFGSYPLKARAAKEERHWKIEIPNVLRDQLQSGALKITLMDPDGSVHMSKDLKVQPSKATAETPAAATDGAKAEVELVHNQGVRYMLGSPRDLISRELKAGKAWEQHTTTVASALIGRQLADGRALCVLDIGANLGAFCLPLAHQFRREAVHFYAFEAQRLVSYQLAGNVYLNRLQQVTVQHMAMGERDGTVEIPCLDLEKDVNVGAFTLSEEVRSWQRPEQAGLSAARERVQMQCLDTLSLPPADLMKIDVEGLELEVLLGGKAYLARSGWPPIILEVWSESFTEFAPTRKKLLTLLEQLDYHLFLHGEFGVAQHRSRKILDIVLDGARIQMRPAPANANANANAK